MSDVAKKPKTEQTTEAKVEKVHSFGPREREEKWPLNKLMRYAKRHQTEDAWMAYSPSSYKSAKAKGLLDQCTAHMTKKLALVKPKAKRKAAKEA